MDYLEKVLGIKTVYENTQLESFPNYITTRYQMRVALLDEKKVLLLFPKTELEQIGTLKKHIERVKDAVNLPVVLILKELTYRQKEYLIRERIPFIADGKQIYLPFMAIYLQERCSAEKGAKEEILPSAQMLFLHFIYRGAHELSTSQAARDLNLTPTSISRASKQLEEMSLLRVKKEGVQKILFSEDSPRVLFEKAIDVLVNPIKKTVYIPEELAGTDLMKSGYSALSEYSMLNTPKVRCYATDSISKWNDVSTDNLHDSETQVAVEMWRYDPKKLSDEKIVDVLSLALALRKDEDERVEEAVEEMLNDLWRRLDGYRN